MKFLEKTKLLQFIAIFLFLFIPIFFYGNPSPIEIRDEYELMDANLRLSAMGNIDLVIEDITNKINAWDFGELGAGLVDEGNIKPFLSIPGIVGFDMTEEEISQEQYFVDKLQGSGIVRIGSNNAFSGSIGIYRKRLSYYSLIDGYIKSNSKTINDTLIFAHKFEHFIFGVRGAYDFNSTTTTYFFGPRYHINILYGEPSFLLKAKNIPWTIGLGYQYKKIKHHFDDYDGQEEYLFHAIKLPLIHSGQALNLGIKFGYQLLKSSNENTIQKKGSFKIQARHKIRFDDKYLMIGFVSGYENREWYFLPRYIGIDSNKEFQIGFGLSYLNLLGIQYQHEINYPAYNQTAHFNRISQGCEILFANKQIPIRLGYSFGFAPQSSAYYLNELESIISAGVGFYPDDSKLKIDFAGRLKFFKYEDWWYTALNLGACFKVF
ncbi:MAG: hypothetical protein ACUVTF_07835 [bacterium]